MQKHSNLYRIFVMDQQANPMAVERVVIILKAVLDRYRESNDTS